jgi:hypothetical protein
LSRSSESPSAAPWPHGDDPEDQSAIEDGSKYYWQHKAEWDAWCAGLRGAALL